MLDKITEQIFALYKQKEQERIKQREMEKNEIKKALYKEKPIAHFIRANKEGFLYSCILEGEEGQPNPVGFQVPFSDIGDATFYPDMDAKLLIRYLI